MFEGLMQPMHLLVIGFIALIVFGPKKLPELGKGLGEGIRQFKKSMNDVSNGSTDKATPSATSTRPDTIEKHSEHGQSRGS